MSQYFSRKYSPINLLALNALTFFTPLASASLAELVISEYIEGSSFNKAIEIYNGTGSPVNLAAGGYQLELYSNGSPTISQSVLLSGTITDGDVFVLAHGSADATILAQADLISTSVINFNGNDAVVLRKNGIVVDAFGQIGVDPGSQWPGGGQNDTLRRAESVCVGDTDPNDAFDAAIEWDIFVQNDFDGLGSHTVNCAGGPIDPIINEFSASTTGPDVEFIEVFGSPGTDYSAFTILEIEGDSVSPGSIDRIFAVGNTDGGGFWTTNVGTLNIENGSITLLLVEGFTGSVGYDIDSNDDGIIDGAAPWTRIVDDVAVYDGGLSDLSYSSVVLGPNYDGISSFAPGGASRIPNGTDTDAITDWVRNDFHLFGILGYSGTLVIGEAENTPGAVNISQTIIADPVGVCADVATPIHDIQGSGLVSPYVDSIREVEAVVTAVFQGSGYIGGYFVQEEDADTDADPSTSEGLRIFDTANTPAIGDLVRIRGSVTEFFELTQLNNITGFSVCGTGVALPTTTVLSLPVSNVEDFEAYEGMAVTFPQALVIAEYFNFDRFNEIVLTSERHLTPTAEFEPGPDAIAAAANFLLDKITLDDGRSSQNSDPAIHPNGGDFNLTNLFRGGDTVANVTGVLDYSFRLYRVHPTQGADHVAVNLRAAEPELTGGNFKVASFNVLNYFNGDGFGSGFPTSRGADNLDEFTRQRDKIVAAMVNIDADVFGVMEIENDGYGSLSAIQDLVTGLNDATLPGTYSFVDPGIAKIGTDQIAVGFIFNQTKVAPHGSSAILDASVDPRFDDTKNRPALAQTFVATSTGSILTVAVNHLKSKGSNCDSVGDPNTGDGAGNCNLTRASAAAALVDWLASDPTDSNDSDVLIIGDLNSYDKEEPIDVLIDGGYTDLAASFNGEAAYSYVFDGQIGYLDYALANPSLLSQVTGITEWHINADEPDLIDYDTSFKKDAQDAIYAPDAYRSSDHDPVIVGLELLNYGFTGFFRPIDNMPAINRIKAGRSVPVKFSLNSNYGLDILADGYPISQQIDCDSGSLLGESEETATAGSSSLSNEEGSGQYDYVWKTEKAWKNSCRQLSIKLIDGSTHTAHFQLK
ncbi:ExeM/NucH family extracellular endonuclease [Paraglaciecola sp. MB-3u-78]|uniref:ExeM/NucH family extracellular endonuclease n=1 Tax=Paraglaciecola sp. MB-3u-78 TaxID=2058332 RepID=UPI000C32E701|nr:ExeM/NucH family extracellular endonuclease [Paraglaciecola sp. MB-3u-78]PKG96927.1 endonuclease/exonuclease/phosphatase [Paraglaciecola sp. MB-3u-78]